VATRQSILGFRKTFLATFVLSVVIVLCVLFLAAEGAGDSASPGTPEDASTDTAGLALLASLLTSGVSVLGVISTTLIAWRQDRRDSRRQEAELARMALEIEQLRGRRNEASST
jgi:hypothetical protein